MWLGQAGSMTPDLATYPGHRFPAEVIGHAVWLYHVFGLSLRDVELILAERGVRVTHESIRQWCRKFGADFARKLRRRRPRPGDTWHLDEVFLRINGELHYLWRAVDQHGSRQRSAPRPQTGPAEKTAGMPRVDRRSYSGFGSAAGWNRRCPASM